jgi:hypothetical protein
MAFSCKSVINTEIVILMLKRAEEMACFFLVQQSLGQGWHQTIPHHHRQGRLHGTEPHANTQVIQFLIFLTILIPDNNLMTE